jgi:NAD(P)-dependent dehydrogenase (short-subunit alcohol dehydrogenase family)
MSTPFSGRVALVAGGTGGLGRAVSLAFLAAGASVAVTSRNRQDLAALETAAGAARSRLEGHEVDATAGPAVQKLVEAIRARHRRLDALVNTIGGYAGGMPFWEQDARHLDRMLDLNLRSGFALLRAVVPVMLEQGSGAIVNVAAKAAFDHGSQLAGYAASKAAAVALVDSLAADLKGTGVRANSILPSIIDTDANREAMPSADFSRWPKPEDIAKVALFLCSDDAKVIHGAAIPVYGHS